MFSIASLKPMIMKERASKIAYDGTCLVKVPMNMMKDKFGIPYRYSLYIQVIPILGV